MLDAGAEPGGQQQQEERGKAPGPAGRHEAERRQQRAAGQQPALAEALGQEPGGNLERRHPARVGGADQADLGERQPELLGPQREEHVEGFREPVVQEVDGRGGAEDGAGTRFHG